VSFELTSDVVLLLVGVPVALGLAWYAWRNRHLPGALPFLVALPLGALWSLAGAGELLAPVLQDKLIWSDLQYFAKAFIPVAWLAVLLDYAGRQTWLRPRRLALLCLVPVITTALLWTNDLHHLMRMQESLLYANGSQQMVAFSWGIWFWIHMLYSYALLTAAVVLMVSVCCSSPPLYRRQPLALLVGSAIPIAIHVGFIFNVQLGITLDYTPIGFTIGGIVIAWGLFHMRLFNLAPVARHSFVEDMTNGVLVLDRADRVVDLNRSAEGLIGRPKRQILSRCLADTWAAWSQVAASCRADSGRTELRLGEESDMRHYEVEWSPVRRRQDTVGRLVVVQDVTARVVLEEDLRRQALTDSLTGLPNRALFMTRLDDAIRQARRRPDMLFAVTVLDLDRFKLINDTIGHLAGDVLLRNVADKLSRCVREADTVARMGGDEFMIVLHDIGSVRDLLPILDRIHQELRIPVVFRQHEMTTDASVGVVMWNPSFEDPEDLLRAADTAMYRAKEDGRGCHRFFDEDMHKELLRTLKAENDLRASLKQREFSLAYQPIVDLRTGTIRSLEALIRWHHPERGVVFPAEFLAVAENSGLIVALGEMCLEEVCSQISRWQSPVCPAAGLPIGFNLSPRQLTEPDFVTNVAALLADWRIPPERLTLEITERALVRDPGKARQVMQALRGMGMRLCLDDFGTGWSSLQHLSTFPVQQLKIDQSFVSRLAKGNIDYEVVRSLTALAHTLGLQVTGEGVERSEQWRLLEDIGCDCAQGYYVARPMDPDELLQFLEDLARGTCEANRPAGPRAAVAPSAGAEPEREATRLREASYPVWTTPPPLAAD
jgi:diguanylate cyclase (GGDEF)-like protein